MSNPHLLMCTALVWLAVSAALRADERCDTSGYHGRVACWALPTNTKAYTGYYVGGGQAVGGSGRYTDEGTWGWDYRGLVLPSRVALWFNHGARYQGGGGSYKVDGHPVPDLPAELNPAFKGRRLEK
jgi:hypothetical protein